jgi:hypothetical protein
MEGLVLENMEGTDDIIDRARDNAAAGVLNMDDRR